MRGLLRRGVRAGAVRRGHGRPVRRGAVGDRDDGVVLGGLQHGEAAGGVDGGRLGVRGAQDRDQPAVPVDHRLPGSAKIGQGRGCRRGRGGQGRDGEADGHRGGGQGDEHGGSAHGCGSCRSGRGGAGPPRRTPAGPGARPLPRAEAPAAFDGRGGCCRSDARGAGDAQLNVPRCSFRVRGCAQRRSADGGGPGRMEQGPGGGRSARGRAPGGTTGRRAPLGPPRGRLGHPARHAGRGAVPRAGVTGRQYRRRPAHRDRLVGRARHARYLVERT